MTKAAEKWDSEKVRFDLIPARPLFEIAEILTFGAKKYGDRNWESGFRWGRLFAACMRHLWAWWGGEEFDQESGRSHLAHAACCLVMLMETVHRFPEHDDRKEPKQ